jgi:uncharacterized coiled-coil DUF342 family protein
VLYAEGNPSKQDMVKFQASLQQMFIKQGKTIKMLVVCDRDYHPELTELSKKLQKKNEHIAWHVWERNEIENYLLSLTALGKLAKPKKQAPNTQQVQPSFAPDKTFLDNLEDTFWKCIDIQRDDVEDQFMKTFEEYYNGKDKKMGWDISTISKKVREYMNTHWEQNKIRLADSKKVISHISGWFQSQKLASFSANMLAEKLEASDLPPEIHEFCERLGEFAGVS